MISGCFTGVLSIKTEAEGNETRPATDPPYVYSEEQQAAVPHKAVVRCYQQERRGLLS